MSLTPARRDSITGLVNATIKDVKKAVITIKTPRGGENRIGLPDGKRLCMVLRTGGKKKGA